MPGREPGDRRAVGRRRSPCCSCVKRCGYPRVPGPLIVVVGSASCSSPSPASRAPASTLIAPVPQGFPRPSCRRFAHLGAARAGRARDRDDGVPRVGGGGPRHPQAGRAADRQQSGAASPRAPRTRSASFFKTLPSAGGFSQSAVNQGAGARTQLASIVTVVLALLVVLFLGAGAEPAAAGDARRARVRRGARAHRHRLARAVLRASVARTSGSPSSTAVIGLTAGLLAAVAVGVVSTLVAGAPRAEPVARRRRQARRRSAPDPARSGRSTPRTCSRTRTPCSRRRTAHPGHPRASRSSSPGCRSRPR